MHEDETTEATRRIPIQSMARLIYGPPKRARVRLPHRWIFVAAFLGATVGCATTRPPVAAEVESVGQLAPSYASIATAPVHHDAPPEMGQVIDTDEDAPEPTVAAAPAAPVEAPAPVEKVAHGF